MKFQLFIDKEAEEAVQATVHEKSEFTAELENLVLQYNGRDKLPVYKEEEARLLPLEEIECIAVQNGKTFAVARDGQQYRLRCRLCALEGRLPQYFIRINKSAIANLSRIEKLCASFNGSVDAVFQCGWRDYVSRRCLTGLKRSLGLK